MANLPCPRFEFRWAQIDGWHQRECRYSLVLPLRKHDIRREKNDGVELDEISLLIGTTKVTGGDGKRPIAVDGTVHTPFRDFAHAQWDCESLGGQVPIVAVCEDVFAVIEHEPKPAIEAPPPPSGELK